MTITVEIIEQQSPLLGRQLVHDERSRMFAVRRKVDRSAWRDKAVRIYDPLPNPNQRVGCCTHVAKACQFNAVGNRRMGVVLDMKWAEAGYSRNTVLDPFPGEWPPTDTGSSGLASCKTAIETGDGGEYHWIFNGADGVIQEVMAGRVISVGTWWYADMFGAYRTHAGLPVIGPTGGKVGGHQYVIRGYDKSSDLALGRCWWGGFRDFWITRDNLDNLIRDGGDAHFQTRT